MVPDDVIRETLRKIARDRVGTFCPSEAARQLADDWRPLMPSVRRIAAILVAQGELQCTRGGKKVDPLAPGGPIRLSGRHSNLQTRSDE